MAAMLALVACGTSEASTNEPSSAINDDAPTSAAATSLPNACSLLTTAQIKAVTNVVLNEGEPNEALSTADRAICDWKSPDGPSPFVQVLVSVGADGVAAEREFAESQMGASTDVGVVGGGSAYTVADGSILGMSVGNFFVQVTYFTGDTADVSVTTVALAQYVVKAL